MVTNLADMNTKENWKTYMTLSRAEAAFRDLKTELCMRPIFHQKEKRTKAHLFIGLLAYHLLISIETRLRENGDLREWKKIKSFFSTHQRMTISLVVENNKIYGVRLSDKPESAHQSIYTSPGVVDKLKKLKSSIQASDFKKQ